MSRNPLGQTAPGGQVPLTATCVPRCCVGSCPAAWPRGPTKTVSVRVRPTSAPLGLGSSLETGDVPTCCPRVGRWPRTPRAIPWTMVTGVGIPPPSTTPATVPTAAPTTRRATPKIFLWMNPPSDRRVLLRKSHVICVVPSVPGVLQSGSNEAAPCRREPARRLP